MSTHNICFRGEIRKIFTGYPPLSRPMLWPVLFINIFYNVNLYSETPIRLCISAGWSEPLLYLHTIRAIFSKMFLKI